MQALGESVREMPGVENMSRLNLAMQHEEEVQRYIEQGNMKPHEVVLYVLDHGSTGMKISMLQHLERTLRETEERNVAQIINAINEFWKEEVEVQVAAPAALIPVLSLLPASVMPSLLHGIEAMLEVRSEEVRVAWNALALGMIDVLAVPAIVRDVVPLALKKADHSEPQDQRALCCKLIGKMGSKLSSQQMVDLLLTKALALCQDTDACVRVAMCSSLAEVARAVGLDVTKARITHELFELLVDEEKLVSRAAFTCLIDLVEFFDPPYRREHFYPIIRSYISSPPDEVLTLLIEEFGRFLWKIRSDIQGAEDTVLFANFFRQCAQKPDQDVRRLCAYNLPAVVASLSKNTYSTHLSQVTRALSIDTHPPVRRSIAAGLHELFTLLGEKAPFFLKEPFTALLSDTTVEVRTLLVQHLDLMLKAFGAAFKGEEREAFFAQITPAIVNYEAAIQKDWRKVGVLLKSFRAFPDYFTGQVVYDKFLPILVRHLQFGAAALKPQCAEFIVHFSKRIENNHLVVNIFSRIVNETFGRSTSCYNRLAYLQIFEECTRLYSRRFLRDRMLESVCGLAEDSVPAVRVALTKVLPKVKLLLRPPVDDDSVKHYQKAMGKLHADTNSDVTAVFSVVQRELDDLDKEYSRQQALRTANAADEAAERQREESEGNLLELAREQEKNERREKIREMLKETMEPGKRPGPTRGRGGVSRPGAIASTYVRPVPSHVAPATSSGVTRSSPKAASGTATRRV